ncbi:phosphonate ABC transporter, permease protein PhnE [Planococcus sp. ISL-109]|uniref:phosphonate ABC transporter, permease protein PhnE n=1 Tax=Planococcus sp. ISL-109 TaxID=2819166 RepID=UPI001BED36AD|nr:phosphonate ABC transporter, permease protein PhnE [Planococcus sp. ISL-109]MBT2582227.1 phosphonate ABC transporter, permease protein PhnE [Planococcus sp. ISL-109]
MVVKTGQTDAIRSNREKTLGKVDQLLERHSNRSKRMNRERGLVGVIVLALVVWSWVMTEFKLSFLWSGLGNIANFFVNDLLPPDFSVLPRYLQPVIDTLVMSYLGMVMAVILSLVAGVLAASNTSPHKFVAFIFRSIVSFLRAIPALVWGLVLVSAFGLGSLAGTIAIGISGVGILGKAFADIIEEIDEGQVEGVKATGASWLQVLGRAVWPQFMAGFVAWSLYKMDLNIREAAVLGLIGAGGIGVALNSSIKLFQYQEAATGILIIFAMIIAVEYITSRVRKSIL